MKILNPNKRLQTPTEDPRSDSIGLRGERYPIRLRIEDMPSKGHKISTALDTPLLLTHLVQRWSSFSQTDARAIQKHAGHSKPNGNKTLIINIEKISLERIGHVLRMGPKRQSVAC